MCSLFNLIIKMCENNINLLKKSQLNHVILNTCKFEKTNLCCY